MTEQRLPIGRLAFRQVGLAWIAYYAMPDTMHDAVPLAEIALALVQKPERKEAFIALMRDVVSDIIEEKTGERLVWPTAAKPAPFWEGLERKT